MSALLRVGASRTDITVFEPGMPMLGWAIQENVSEGVHTPLEARAFVFHDVDADRRVAFVCADLSMITDSLRLGVLERLEVRVPELGIGTSELLLTATHTHSGPGGYGHHLFYNLPNPGFSPRVLRTLIDRIVDGIVEAAAAARPARLRISTTRVPEAEPIAFNRSLAAYNRNPEVRTVRWEQRRTAVDRNMTVLRIDDADGAPIGLIDWFPLHGTSVHADNTLLHPDNKGIAARLTEAELGPGSVAAFAQSAAGDVSPNYRYSVRRRRMIGASDDDFESANIAGRIQHDYAGRAWREAGEVAAEPPVLDALMLHMDMRGFEADPRYTGGRSGCHTGAGRMGLTFLEGTAEGPGPLMAVPAVAPTASRLARVRQSYRHLRARYSDAAQWDDVHGPKFPFLDVGYGAAARAFGRFRADKPVIPGMVDRVVRSMKEFGEIDAVVVREWIPNVMPLQVVILGRLALVAVPAEPTTVSGARLAVSALAALAPRGVEQVVISGYSNGYSGYVTTHEEYQAQRYEGASTIHGQWTLAAYQTRLDTLCRRLCAPVTSRDTDPGPPIRPHRPAEVYAQAWAGR